MESAVGGNGATGCSTGCLAAVIVFVAELRSVVKHGKKELHYILCSSIARARMSKGSNFFVVVISKNGCVSFTMKDSSFKLQCIYLKMLNLGGGVQ
jgi:hypothetical protein